jgi:hypothetical protein
MDNKIQTGLRIPEPLYERWQSKAVDMGVSLNSLILMMANIGDALMENGFILPEQ